MNLVETLNKSIKDQDWNLVVKALNMINGTEQSVKPDMVNVVQNTENKNPFMINKPTISKTQSNVFKPPENKFVDDLSLEPDLIEKNPVAVNKQYRKPHNENDFYKDVTCRKCNKQYSITKEEYNFKSSDSESSPFICIKCIRQSSRR